MRLSVVVPTYGEPERLLAALRSLAAQDYPTDRVQIVVVDDGSPVFDPAPLVGAAGPLELAVARHETNQGRARARNTGIHRASGEVVVFLDSDMTVVPGFLRAHAELHGQEDHAVGIGDIRFGGGVPSTRLSRYLETRGVHKLAPGEPVPFKCFATGNASVRRDRLLQAGLFDEEFTAYGGEDLELGYRLHLQGARFRFLAKGLAHHHHLRRLDELCSLMYTYGRSSIPILLRKHPELAPVLRLGFLDRPRWSIERLLLRAALFRPAYWPVRAAVGWGCAVPSLALDYLWWHNRTRGYLDAVRASRHSGGRRTVADERTSS